MLRILYFRHGKSFQFAFLLLCFFWTTIRAAFFASTAETPLFLTLILWWFPVDVQFATFSLLVVFVIYLLQQHEWNYTRRIIYFVYCGVNLSVVGLTAVYVWQGAEQNELTESLEKAHHWSVYFDHSDSYISLRRYLSFQSLLLVVIYAWYGFKLSKMHQRTALDNPSATVVTVVIFTWLISYLAVSTTS
jgi:hypothetical protein